jgi:uncharacterized membrane protein HdeD (DUF308 family)
MIEGFLLGVIVTASVTAAGFFVRFWRQTRDGFFLWFAAAFLIEGANRMAFLFLERPNEGSPLLYIVRLIAFLLIVAAIAFKNAGKAKSP